LFTLNAVPLPADCCSNFTQLPSFLSPFNSDISPPILADNHFHFITLLLSEGN